MVKGRRRETNSVLDAPILSDSRLVYRWICQLISERTKVTSEQGNEGLDMFNFVMGCYSGRMKGRKNEYYRMRNGGQSCRVLYLCGESCITPDKISSFISKFCPYHQVNRERFLLLSPSSMIRTIK